MQFSLISLFPEIFQALNYGIARRALEQKLIQLHHFNPRDFTHDPHHTVDDRPYGGGPGMVMKYEPLSQAILAAKDKAPDSVPTLYLSPQGEPLTQEIVVQLAQQPHLILVAGRYEGIDERVIEQHIDAEYSIGDYVLSGGEIPALALIDAITRLLPGALGHEDSAAQDSFSNKGLLDCPHYTRPEEINGLQVPAVLLSGDHQAISDWRAQQALKKTWQKRPDLLKKLSLSSQEKTSIQTWQNEQNQPDDLAKQEKHDERSD